MATVRVDLSRRAIRRLTLGLLTANLAFTAGTALFIYEWTRRDQHGRLGRAVIAYVMVQFHLATENVVAAWYSSMLLLSVALASLLAFATEKRGHPPFFAKKGDRRLFAAGWLVIAAVFAGLSLDEMGSFHERLGMLHRHGAAAAGWVYVLVIPIGLVALFMLAFAWSHLRRAPAAALLFAAGTLLFLSDPIFELAEMSLLRARVSSDLAIHNILLVIEEGIVELGGALCFLVGVLVYIRRTAGDGPHLFGLGGPRTALTVATAALFMTAAVPGAHWLVTRLPPGDTGIPDNWFPSAVLYVDALLAVGLYGVRARGLAIVLLALSAAFGAALYGYMGWFARIGYPGEALDAAVTAVACIGLCALCASEVGQPDLVSP